MITSLPTSTIAAPIALPLADAYQPINERAILAKLNIGTWALEPGNTQINTCKVFQKLLSLPIKSSYSFNELFSMVTLPARPKLLHQLREACHSDAPFSIEFETNTAGCAQWFKLEGAWHKTPGYKAPSLLGTLTDVTTQKLREVWNNDRLALLNHELKSPLSVIKLYLQSTAKVSTGKNKQEVNSFIERADQQVNRMVSLMDDLLMPAANNKAAIALNHECFDLSKLTKDIAKDMELQHQGRKFAINTIAGLYIKADKQKITQVIINYLSNAVKYSTAGSDIAIKCGLNAGNVILQVNNAGAGISKAHQEKVFDRYYRTPGAIAEGVGLGLYLVKNIITRHGGRVWVESEPNQGATFFFEIPVNN